MVKESTYSSEGLVRCVGLAALGIMGAIAGGEDAQEERNARRKAETKWDEANRARQNAER
jgi:hypothetical protein